jgi:hypothetical protein
MVSGKNRFFQAARVAEVVGMPEKRLSKFVESPGYKIRPSLREKAGRGAPRLYDLSDLLSVALAWWLFQAGFRSQVIGRVLKAPGIEKWLRESERWDPEEATSRFLAVKREMASTEPPSQSAFIKDFDEIAVEIRAADRYGFQVLPIGSLLSALWERLRGMDF